MSFNVLFRLRPIVLAVAICGVSSIAHAQEFSQTVVFGDSLSDTGRLQASIKGSFFASLFLPTPYGSFTTNPDTTWAGVLANSYGHEAKANDGKTLAGTNYAVGGARAKENVNKAVLTIPSVKSQMDGYFKLTDNKADPNALYTVWIGANDLLAASEQKEPSQQLSTVVGAASYQAVAVDRLHQAGAAYILVPNIPDIGLTPRVVKNFEESFKATTATTLYNKTLYQALNTQQANVIPANTFALLQEAVKDKTAFGFETVDDVACKNLSSTIGSLGCTTKDWKSANANETYAFADDIHPSGRTHRILAQYYRSIIETPAYVGQLPQKLIHDGTRTAKQLNRRLESLDTHRHSLWLDMDTGGEKFITPTNTRPNFMLGFDVVKGQSHTGAYLKYRDHHYQLSSLINADVAQTGVGLYHHHDKNQFRLKAAVGVDRISVATTRQVDWEGAKRTHHADNRSRRVHASLQGSHSIDIGKATYRPYLGVGVQKIKVADLVESDGHLSTALHFHEQNQKSVQGEIGINWEYDVNNTLQLVADIGYRHEFQGKAEPIISSLPSIPEYSKGFAVPVATAKQHSTNAYLGAKLNFGKANVTAGINAQHQNSEHDVGGFIGVQSKF